ncbi:hypothetical protein ABZX85_03725 [Streptomyces sp. NPDC004539]|uniref:hypothetical protein n=1 Tax=Streptomyces sp. NPDC004539 TaxID=3154280 RepID=UPI0033AFCC14
MNGVGCSTLPTHTLPALFSLALLTGIATLGWPRPEATGGRYATLATQWITQFALALMLLTGV